MMTRMPPRTSTSLAIRPAGPPPTIATWLSSAPTMAVLEHVSLGFACSAAVVVNRDGGHGLLGGAQPIRPRDADRHMPGFLGHPLEPPADRGEHRQVVIAKVREVRIGIERNVGDRIAIRNDVAMLLKMAVHHAESAITFLHPILERVLLQFAAAF